MAVQDNGATAQALNDAFNARDWNAAAALSAPDAEFVNVATGQTFRGPSGIQEFLQGWATAFPDSRVETTLVIADDRGAAMEFTGRGTHTGTLESPVGAIPATGRSVVVPFSQVLEFQNGKITHGRLYFDLGGMLQQMGLMPPPGGASH
ncbi:MAG TPA: ester cyclase [Chloroflexota bacterium]|jgi:steroid delta-isomerase-like uncharacterized protein